MKNYDAKLVEDFINSGITIRADYFVGDTRAVISVGFRFGKSTDVPVTLYREDVKKLSHPTCRVLAIFSKEYNKECYNMCTYLSNGYTIDKLPENVKVRLEEKLKESVLEEC